MEHTSPPQHTLPGTTKIACGAGGRTSAFSNYTVRARAVPFYQMTLHVDPAQVGRFLDPLVVLVTCLTPWHVCYAGLGYELSPDYDERTTVMGDASVSGQLASMIAPWVFPFAQLALFTSVIQGMHVATAFVAIVGLIPAVLVREHNARAPAQSP